MSCVWCRAERGKFIYAQPNINAQEAMGASWMWKSPHAPERLILGGMMWYCCGVAIPKMPSNDFTPHALGAIWEYSSASSVGDLACWLGDGDISY